MVLEAALSEGADFSELYVEDTETNNVSMLDGKVENAAYSRSRGAGVRVFSGVMSAYSYTNDISEKALIETAKAAAAGLRADASFSAEAFRRRDYSEEPRMPFSGIDNKARIALMRKAHKVARDYSDEITQLSLRYLDSDKRVLVANSEGIFAFDRRPRTRLFITAVAAKDGDAQTGYLSYAKGMGFEAYDRVDIDALAKRAAKMAVTMLHAPDCPAKVAPVVIGGGFGGVIFHEACGHSLEATSVSKGNSEFTGKLGEKIANKIVTAIDDGTIPGEWGSLHMDDEGTPARRNVLIENGILKGYMIDRLGGRRMEMKPTGNSRRQNYTFAPTSRMTNTYIAPGTDDDEAMIRTMGEGLYAATMGGGSVNPLTGEFNFAVNEGYWVRDGRIVSPVRGATLIGKGADVLMKIDRIGKSMWMEHGMCGSLSGSIPNNVGQPQIRVSEMTIGGKGGAL
jgi:TldD protein